MRTALALLAIMVFAPISARGEAHWDTTPGVPGMAGAGTYGLGVWALEQYKGEVVACGQFDSAGEFACNGIASWDGVAWRPLSTGLNGLGVCLAVRDTSLYVGGFFTSAGGVAGTSYVARWDGQAWHSVGGGTNGRVYGLGVYNDELVAGGPFTSAGGVPASYVARWDGAEWHAMGVGFTAGDPLPTVWCFAEYAGDLVAGGRFSQSGSTVVNRIARWDGAGWQPLGDGVGPDGITATVYDLAVVGSDLIVGGAFQRAGSLEVENLARWDGSQWYSMIPSGFEGTGWNEVSSIYPYGDGLVIGGRFTGLVGKSGTSHLALWDGQDWFSLGNGTNGLVDDFLACDSGLFVAGQFTAVDTATANCAALWTGTSSWGLGVEDVPDDQGGFLRAHWYAHPADTAGASPAVTYYELQRNAGSWAELQLVSATQADSYAVVFETPDTLTLGQTPPSTLYRAIARTTDPDVNHVSPEVEAYSVDNLPPAAPVIELHDDEMHRFMSWQNPAVADFSESCLYRAAEPGSEAGELLLCSAVQYWYTETDLLRYWYRARAFDRHGNASEWSNEVVGRYPTNVPGVLPTELRLYPNQPNPFNPLTTIRFDLPEDGRVRLGVYDVRGGLVRSLVDVDMPRGSHQAVWDGTNSAGQGVPSGSYFARLEARGRQEAVRMLLVR